MRPTADELRRMGFGKKCRPVPEPTFDDAIAIVKDKIEAWAWHNDAPIFAQQILDALNERKNATLSAAERGAKP